MLIRLILLFTIVPFVELYLLLELAARIGAIETLAVVIVTGIVGGALARMEGWKTWRRIQEDLARGIMPSGRLVDGVLILAGGLLLLTPGVLTDGAGFLLLIPFTRAGIKRHLRRKFEDRIRRGAPSLHI
jgi:UPF0716 protein FxsA